MIGGRARRREADRAQALAVCALLLEYPDEGTHAAADEIRDAVATLEPTPAAEALGRFVAWWSGRSLDEIARHYVATFDLTKRCGLYLTFYEEGDKRGRGMALLRLRKLYRAAGLPMASDELPDYLPVMLEFAASAPDGRGLTVLREHRAALEVVRSAVQAEDSPYADLFTAIALVLGDPSPVEWARAAKVAAEGPPQELVGLEPFAAPDVPTTAEARR